MSVTRTIAGLARGSSPLDDAYPAAYFNGCDIFTDPENAAKINNWKAYR
jgi:hypothetical protein